MGQAAKAKMRSGRIIFILIIVVFVLIFFYCLNASRHTTQIPVNYSSVDQYNNQKANSLLAQYIEDSLKQKFIPSFDLKAQQGKQINSNSPSNYFYINFPAKKASVSAMLRYEEKINSYDYLNIIIIPFDVKQTTMNPAQANLLLSEYFKNPYDISDCKKQRVGYCENFQETEKGKIGYGVFVGSLSIGIQKPIVFNCLIPKESKLYKTATTCLGL
jgi:hypothetical protein